MPELPYLFAEVVHACQKEMAQRVGDVLEQRTCVIFADPNHGLGAVADVAELMAHELGWPEEVKTCEVAAYRERVLHLFGSEVGIAA